MGAVTAGAVWRTFLRFLSSSKTGPGGEIAAFILKRTLFKNVI
jgi:hypothetical protein